MRFCIYEDTATDNFRPLVYLRPVYDLRCGIFTLRQKIERAVGRKELFLHARPEILPLLREESARIPDAGLRDDWTFFINGRAVADAGLSRLIGAGKEHECIYRNGDEVAAAVVSPATFRRLRPALGSLLEKGLFDGLPEESIGTKIALYPWDLIHLNPEALVADMRGLRPAKGRGHSETRKGVHLVNARQIVIGRNAVLKPGVVIDAGEGPVVIGDGVQIMPNAVVCGPAAIGAGSVIKIGAKIYGGTTIGPRCKVGGEVEGSVIHSHANKQHDGFLGHSYIASWVNLGADTNTSDLKNTYGPVSVVTEQGKMNTGRQFLGLVMGDHSKSGINVMFDTGTIAGIACNIFGAGLPPKFIPSFSWGGGREFVVHEPDKALETARRVMARREVELTGAYERLFREIFTRTIPLRTKGGIR